MTREIKLGYEIGTGKQVDIPLSHLIVCGISQLSGKTTTIEALLTRSNLKSIVFKTKIGEKSFSGYHEVPPYFRDRSDYEFVRSLIEAYSKEKIFIEKGTLMELCKGSTSLSDIKTSIDNTLLNSKLRAMEREIYTRLQYYLDQLIPQIQTAKLARVFSIRDGINVMNLESMSGEVQSLIIQSVLDEVLMNHRNIIVVIPEAWKFIPQKYGNPCKRSVESFIRQGAANGNFLWADSQDLAGVDKIPLKQVSVYILGYQAERNEVKHTLDQIALPSKSKPTVAEIMSLKKGQFILSSHHGVTKVYVQPIWMTDENAKQISMEEAIPDSKTPPVDPLIPQPVPYPIPLIPQVPDIPQFLCNPQSSQQPRSLLIGDPTVREEIERLWYEVRWIKDQIAAGVGNGDCVVTVFPLEKIKKDFQNEAKEHVLGKIKSLDADQLSILKFVESQGKGCTITHIIDKCLHLSATSGGNRTKISKKLQDMNTLQVIRRDKNSVAYPNLLEFISSYMQVHGASEDEVRQVYDHVLNGMIHA